MVGNGIDRRFPFLIGKVLTVQSKEEQKTTNKEEMFPFLIGKVLTI